ncbi:MAG: hypothetical protein KA746_06345 [Pyrinomonadaceae bacterium]|nr:hypothetical protein [Pyrinomonadaceae bacterium]MBP6211925.1 hypothetical protein [Pyrinomonadaceae bacterium]
MLDRELIEEYGSDVRLFDELVELQRSSGILHGDRPICPFLRPYFLESSRYRDICFAAQALSGAFDALTIAALEYEEVADVLGMSERELAFARFDPGYRSVSITSRLDTFLHADGFKFLEYNAENPAGVGDQRSLEQLFTHIPAVRRFLGATPHFFPQPHQKLLEVLDRAYREYGGKRERPNIAIVDWDGVDTSAEFRILADHFESSGYPTLICDPNSLEYDGKVLRNGEFIVDIFYKRVIIHEFLERFDHTHPISRAMSDRAVCMANSFRSKIPHKKASLAILSDPKYHRLFDAGQADAISKHIPWTRNVLFGETSYGSDTIDLVDFIRQERFRFVLKPNDDYGGKGISFGWECTESEWDDAIESAIASKYVVQERADVARTDIPMFLEGEAVMASLTVDFDPFLFMGEVEGGMVRLAPGSLVNITSGGGETALAIIEGI